MRIEVNGTDFHLMLHHSRRFLRSYAEDLQKTNQSACEHVIENVLALKALETKIAEALPDGELLMTFHDSDASAQDSAWPSTIETLRSSHNGIFGIWLFLGHDGHNKVELLDGDGKYIAWAESGRSMQEAVSNVLERWHTRLRRESDHAAAASEDAKPRAVPVPVEIPEPRSRATQRALDAANDLTAQQVLADKLQLIVPQSMSEGRMRRAIWLDRMSGYLFLGLREVMELMQRPDRVCANCLTQWQDHEREDEDCVTGFLLSPCLSRNRDDLTRQQAMLWEQVKLYQLGQAGYVISLHGDSWIDNRQGRAFPSYQAAWEHMNADVASLYMRECVHCGRQPKSHNAQMVCPNSSGELVYLSRLQSLMSEQQPSLQSLIAERDRPLSETERRL